MRGCSTRMRASRRGAAGRPRARAGSGAGSEARGRRRRACASMRARALGARRSTPWMTQRLVERSADAPPGIERGAAASWCTYWTSRRARRASRGGSPLTARAVEADGAGASRAGGRGSCGRAWTCRSRTRRPAPAISPAASAERHAVDRAHLGRGVPRKRALAAEQRVEAVEPRGWTWRSATCATAPLRRRGRSSPRGRPPRRRRAAAQREHTARADGQRGWKRQPGGGAERRRRRCPGCRRDRARDRDGRRSASACRGGAGGRASRRVGPGLDRLAGVHDHHLVAELGDDAEVVGDEEHRQAESVGEVAEEAEDLQLRGDVERAWWARRR